MRTGYRWTLFLASLIVLQSTGLLFGSVPGQSAKTETQQEKAAGSEIEFRWLTGAGEIRGLRYETQSLPKLQVDQRQYGGETETETVRVDPETVRTTYRTYDLDANGRRQLVETVVEEIRRRPGERIHAVRTTSRRDTNGNFQAVRQDVQDMSPLGQDAYQIEATTYLPDVRNTMAASEQTRQIERMRAGKVVELEKTLWLPDTNGEWGASERRVLTAREVNQQRLSDEEVYRHDADGSFALVERSSSREWKDDQGTDHRRIEIYRLDLEGTLELDSRLTLARTGSADGTRQTTQQWEQRNPAAPSRGLRLIERVIETSRPAGSGSVETETEVQAPDVNGALQTVRIHRIVEVPPK